MTDKAGMSFAQEIFPIDAHHEDDRTLQIVSEFPLPQWDVHSLYLEEDEVDRLMLQGCTSHPCCAEGRDLEDERSTVCSEDSFFDGCDNDDGIGTPSREASSPSCRNGGGVSPRRMHASPDSVGDGRYIARLFEAVRDKEKFELPSECEICSYRYTGQKLSPDAAFMKHAQDAHLNTYIDFQHRRVRDGEIPTPVGVVKGAYLVNMMKYIGDDKSPLPAYCLVPDCQRTGKDRNILSGHFRGGHRKTYNFCQLLLKQHDSDALLERVADLGALSDAQQGKRKYRYLKGQYAHGSGIDKENTGASAGYTQSRKPYKKSKKSARSSPGQHVGDPRSDL